MMKQFFMTVVALLMMSGVASAQQSKSDETVEFRPHWGLKVQGGASYTVGEADFGKLISPAAQLSATYDFHHAMGIRFGFGGWQGKGTVVVTDEIYKFHYLQLHADYVLNLANLIDGFKHDRIWTPYVFAGVAGAYGFDNMMAGEYIPDYKLVLTKYWNLAPFFAVRAGFGADFWVAKNVALGIEALTNAYGDKFNSKGATRFSPDFQFSTLLGVKIRFGGNTAPSKAYAAKVEAERLAAEAAKAEAERLAAEKAEAERIAAEKAAAEAAARAEAERLAAEKAAAEAAAERARICAEQSTEVFFTIGSYSIRKSEVAKIDKLIDFLNTNPDYTVSLVGYADKGTGTPARNMYMSKVRVNVVKEKMIEMGVPVDRIEATYVGDTVQPFAENDKNRVIICTVK